MNASEFEDSFEDEKIIRGEILSMSLGRLPQRPVVALPTTASIAEVIASMNEKRVGAAVITHNGKLVGIFTERDVLTRVVGKSIDIKSVSVETVMTRNPDTLSPDAGVAYALRKMSEEGYRHIPMVDAQGVPAGIIAVRDIVRWLVDLFPDAMNLPPNPSLESRSVDGG
ncbi:MAG: CBS domain-containing protein [Leptospirales bacterium]|nr:CBS domain-containing protein [Leptospirales bacterium]